MKKIVLAGGCFWGIQAYLDKIKGITRTEVGYCNGNIENPTYQEVCTGGTGHAECVMIEYDEAVLPLKKLLKRFTFIIDPTLYNRQGPDVGSQYRTGVYYVDEVDKLAIDNYFKVLQKNYDQKIMTEQIPLTAYYKAEDYHQKYLEKNPNGYCYIDLTNVQEDL